MSSVDAEARARERGRLSDLLPRGPQAQSEAPGPQDQRKAVTIQEIRERTGAKRPGSEDKDPCVKEPSQLDGQMVAPLTYQEEPVLEVAEVVKVRVAVDSGSVDHVASPSDIPGSVNVEQPADGKLRNFVGANNSPIANYGMALVNLEQADGDFKLSNVFQVADVCRPLHSVSKIADTDKNVLFTKKAAYVVPEGIFDKILAAITPMAVYPRVGGLYVAEMLVKDPKHDGTGKSLGFGRQGQGR